MTPTPSLRALSLLVAAGLVACTAGFAAASATELGATRLTAQAGAGSATDDPAGPGQKRLGRWQARLQERLGLTDDQVTRLGQVFQRNMQTARPHGEAIRAARAELRRLVLIEADQASIEAKQTELQQLLAQKEQMRVQTLKEITPILTPEQREKFAEMMEKRGRFAGRHHRHRHHQRPGPGQS